MAMHKIIVDPGHGGHDPGAVGVGGGKESEIVFSIAKKYQSISPFFGIDTILTRFDDSFVSLSSRVAYANGLNPACFLSFHCNSAQVLSASGFEVYTTIGQTPADSLATLIFNNLLAISPYKGRPDYDDGDPDKEAQFYVLRKTNCPAVLIEFGFLSNPFDVVVLKSDNFQSAFAVATAIATSRWLEGK